MKRLIKTIVATGLAIFITATPVLASVRYYSVIKSETLTEIANKHGISISTILSANPTLSANYKLQSGDTVIIPDTNNNSYTTNNNKNNVVKYKYNGRTYRYQNGNGTAYENYNKNNYNYKYNYNPKITNKPVVTNKPVITNKPIITNNPVITNKPIITNNPVITANPVVPPVTTQTPIITAVPTKNAPTTEISSNSSFEKQVADLVNVQRSNFGLQPITLANDVSSIARTKSADMRDKNYFDHTSPTYGSPFSMLNQFGVNYKTAGENIAKGQKTPEAVMNAWMNSPGHKANILNVNFKELGVGYVTSSSGTTYWTQMFVTR